MHLEGLDGLVCHMWSGTENKVNSIYANYSSAARLFWPSSEMHSTTTEGNQEDNVHLSDSAVYLESVERLVSYLWKSLPYTNNKVSVLSQPSIFNNYSSSPNGL